MKDKLTRRGWLRGGIASGLSFPFITTSITRAKAARSCELRVGGIGVGGKGWGDINDTTKENARVVAICDIDAERLDRAAKRFPEARTFTDWRELLQMEELDAVTVSTPDHTHAPATMTAIRRGLHVYCQKPLTHSVWEARQIALAAARHGVVTQMGTQGRSSASSMLEVEHLRSGVLGRIRQIHLWTNRPVWPQGIERPPAKPSPEGVAWDEWIGPAPYRNFHESLHPFKWRGWLDFGTGALGDMGCHGLLPIWDGLELPAPTEVWAEGEPPRDGTYPKSGIVHYQFPAGGRTGGEFELIWYDGGNLPARGLFPSLPDDWEMPESGSLIIGEEGSMIGYRLYPEDKFPTSEYPEVRGDDHYLQWTNACLDPERGSLCPFDKLSGPVTEAILLGNIAARFPGRKLRWDTDTLSFPDFAEADRFLRRDYREGWRIEGLG